MVQTLTITFSIAVCPLISPDPTCFARAGYKRITAQIVGTATFGPHGCIYGIDSTRLPRSQNGPRATASPNSKSGLVSLGEAEALPRPARPVTPRVCACFQLRPDRPSPQSQSFPYLHCSIDQRLFTLETCCGYGYDLRRESTLVSQIFKGRPVQHRTLLQTQLSTGPGYGAAVPISDPVGFRQTTPYKDAGLLPASLGTIASQL